MQTFLNLHFNVHDGIVEDAAGQPVPICYVLPVTSARHAILLMCITGMHVGNQLKEAGISVSCVQKQNHSLCRCCGKCVVCR